MDIYKKFSPQPKIILILVCLVFDSLVLVLIDLNNIDVSLISDHFNFNVSEILKLNISLHKNKSCAVLLEDVQLIDQAVQV
ncbi:MAG: hypothetical protein CM15mP98_12610 [Paracoccaceae bacterium]|nr:MAG: hypothetical protein CM15mP98_12610 [Paracoccaceae bacterium]